jgi:hypothetical protein
VSRYRRVLSVPRAKSFRYCVDRTIESDGVASLDSRAERRTEHQTLGGVAGADAAGQCNSLTRDVHEAGRERATTDGARVACFIILPSAVSSGGPPRVPIAWLEWLAVHHARLSDLCIGEEVTTKCWVHCGFMLRHPAQSLAAKANKANGKLTEGKIG